MLYNALYLALLVLELLLFMSIAVYVISLIFSWLKGAPYVATQDKEIEEILKKAQIKKGHTFLELGCGDGRVIRKADKKFGIKGVGVDINPILILKCKIISLIQKIKNITFQTKNVFDVDLRKYDIIYIYLFPALVEKMKDTLLHETKKNAVIISHGFKITYLSRFLFDLRKGTSFTTYYYRISRN